VPGVNRVKVKDKSGQIRTLIEKKCKGRVDDFEGGDLVDDATDETEDGDAVEVVGFDTYRVVRTGETFAGVD
jgi:hypothetical protein